MEYEFIEGQISEGDWMLINNPHPDSAIKNRIRKCHTIYNHEGVLHYCYFISPDNNGVGYLSGMYPQSCVKRIKILA